MNSDYSMFQNRPTLGSSLSGLAQSIQGIRTQQQQSKLAEIAMQQEQLKAQQAQDEQKKRADYDKRVSQYMNLLAINPQMPLEQREDLKNRIFAPEMLQQQIKNPFEAEALRLRSQSLEQGNTRLNQQAEAEQRRLDQGTQKQALEEKKFNELLNSNRYKEAADYRDYLQKDNQYKADDKYRYDVMEMQRTLPAREYGIKQDQLLGQVPASIRDLYKGNSLQSAQGQDLTDDAVKKVTVATEGASKIVSNTDKLLSKLNAVGNQKLPTKDKAEMESILGNILLQFKSEPFANLGVLTGPDLEIMYGITGNPTSFTSLSTENQKAKLEQFRKGLVEGYNKLLITRGFNPADINKIQSMGNVGVELDDSDKSLIKRK